VEGYLTHQDSMGTKETLSKGAIQFMTAGSGVVHSEHNLDSSAPLRFIQMWIKTRQMNLPPNYGSDTGDADLRHNKWMHMVSDVEKCSVVHTPIHINQDVNIFVTEMDPGVNLSFDLEEGRQAYLLCIEGSASLSNDEDSSVVNVERHDAAELYGGMKLSAVASPETGAHLLMVEMQYTGKGRSDL
jgi:redox-sensitive bicupin YhaK (pirin superfamily)